MTAILIEPAATPGEGAGPMPIVSKPIPTPEQFASACREIVRLHKGDIAHRVLDQVVTALLISLGYGEGMAIFVEGVQSYHDVSVKR